MATIIRSEERDFQPNPNKIDGFRLFTDATRAQKGVNPQWLNFDVRRLNPHECNQLTISIATLRSCLLYSKERHRCAHQNAWRL